MSEDKTPDPERELDEQQKKEAEATQKQGTANNSAPADDVIIIK